jgi:hypothetical protein
MRDNGKTTFLLSNSSIEYVDAGMRYIVGKDWMKSFDLVMTSAAKPSFYTSRKPFREVRTTQLNTSERRYPGVRYDLKWTQVQQLLPGRVYSGGNLRDLMRMTGWKVCKYVVRFLFFFCFFYVTVYINSAYIYISSASSLSNPQWDIGQCECIAASNCLARVMGPAQ